MNERISNARLDRAERGAKAVERLIAKIDEREKISCGTAEGRSWNEAERVAADAPRGYDSCRGGETAQLGEAECLLIPKGKTASEYQASPAGIDLRTTPERAVDKYWGKYLLEIAKLQLAANGIAVKESK